MHEPIKYLCRIGSGHPFFGSEIAVGRHHDILAVKDRHRLSIGRRNLRFIGVRRHFLIRIGHAAILQVAVNDVGKLFTAYRRLRLEVSVLIARQNTLSCNGIHGITGCPLGNIF